MYLAGSLIIQRDLLRMIVFMFMFGIIVLQCHTVRFLCIIDLELNGMGYGETPPPLPVKSSMGDYGNLMENPELASPTTPPPPPLHQRVQHTHTDTHAPFMQAVKPSYAKPN